MSNYFLITIRYLTSAVHTRCVPAGQLVSQQATTLQKLIKERVPLLVHDRSGKMRSTLLADSEVCWSVVVMLLIIFVVYLFFYLFIL